MGKRQIGVKLDEALIARLDQAAGKAGLTRTALIEHFCEHGLIEPAESAARTRIVHAAPVPVRADHGFNPQPWPGQLRCRVCGVTAGRHT